MRSTRLEICAVADVLSAKDFRQMWLQACWSIVATLGRVFVAVPFCRCVRSSFMRSDFRMYEHASFGHRSSNFGVRRTEGNYYVAESIAVTARLDRAGRQSLGNTHVALVRIVAPGERLREFVVKSRAGSLSWLNGILYAGVSCTDW
jgi:hypothetical protein